MKAATPQGHALGSLDPGEGSQTPQSAMSLNEELLKLRQQVKEQEKEIRRLKKENDFPEEAGAFFAASRLRSAKTKECRLLRPKSYVFFRKTPKTILTGLSVPKVIQSPRNEKKPGKSGVSGQEIIPMEISIGTLEQGYKDSNLEVTESESVVSGLKSLDFSSIAGKKQWKLTCELTCWTEWDLFFYQTPLY